jgi:hypothetical protein
MVVEMFISLELTLHAEKYHKIELHFMYCHMCIIE